MATEEAVTAYRGVIVIEWPAPNGGGPYSCMAGCLLAITDAVTGKLITTCSEADITVRAGAEALVTAGLTLFASEDGEPILDGDGEPVVKDGEILTGTFPFLVSEMRVRK